mmetsp:Transcript_41316/g.124691  ORF Transcript_41316/g.124691 Transcript_41316/m.124691 type:complete len:309 (+) Transcript_41316:4621-5547(+)
MLRRLGAGQKIHRLFNLKLRLANFLGNNLDCLLGLLLLLEILASLHLGIALLGQHELLLSGGTPLAIFGFLLFLRPQLLARLDLVGQTRLDASHTGRQLAEGNYGPRRRLPRIHDVRGQFLVGVGRCIQLPLEELLDLLEALLRDFALQHSSPRLEHLVGLLLQQDNPVGGPLHAVVGLGLGRRRGIVRLLLLLPLRRRRRILRRARRSVWGRSRRSPLRFDDQVALYIAIPGYPPSCSRREGGVDFASAPDFRASDLASEPPTRKAWAIARVPVIHVHLDVLNTVRHLGPLEDLLAVIRAYLSILAH